MPGYDTAPDFLIIGAQKAGTTWLYRNFQEHPGIWMPKEKELHYFDEKAQNSASLRDKAFGTRGQDRRWQRQFKRQLRSHSDGFSMKDLAWDLNYFMRRPSDKWYASLFRQGRDKIAGEATPDYSTLGLEAVERVHRVAPEAKIIFMMRNPIERVWSAAMMAAELGGGWQAATDEHFHKHFDSKRSRLLSDYLGTLEKWSSYYPEEQIFVGFIEDISLYPGRLLRGIYEFLGAEPAKPPKVIQRKIHTRSVETIPTRMAARIAQLYSEDIERLSDLFGGYASFWLHCARKLVEASPGEEEIPYPLWESYLWQEWKENREAREDGPQSGPLSSIKLSA